MTYLEVIRARPYFIPLGAIGRSTNVRPIGRASDRQALMNTFSMPIQVVLRTEACTRAFAIRPRTSIWLCVAKSVLSS